MATRPGSPTGPDIASAAVLRILSGALMAWAMLRYFAHDWIHLQFEAPSYFFSYPGLEFLQPLPAPGMQILFACLLIASLLILIGLYYRVAIVFFTLGFTYVHLLDQSNYLNHYYLVSLMGALMCCMPHAGAWSLDARRRPAIRRQHMPRLALFLLRFQVACVYVFAGIAKLGDDWLVEAQPLTIWLSTTEPLPLIGDLLHRPWVASAASWFGLVFDLSIPFLLMWRRTAPCAFLVAVGFHLATAWLFPIGLFPAFMLAFATILLPADWPRRFPGLRRTHETAAPRETAVPRWLYLPAALYVALQLLIPLRSHLHAGNVLWHEQGMRFSWRVMVMDKAGTVRFEVVDRDSGARVPLDPKDELTAYQARTMATQPTMIVRYAEHLAGRARSRGHERVSVYAIGAVSLNGRPSTPLFDPTQSLAGEDAPERPLRALRPAP